LDCLSSSTDEFAGVGVSKQRVVRVTAADRRNPMGRALDLVNRFYATTDAHDVDGIAEHVAEDVSFVGPLMATQDANAYLEINRQLLSHHAATRMLHQFESGDAVCSVYEMDIVAPDGTTFTAEMADVIQVAGDKIVSQRIYYDPRRFAEAFDL
jgi:ketosteroid isomerase-like protein